MYDILCGISKVLLDIPHKISYPYIERYDFHTKLKFEELFDLRNHTRFLNAPLYMWDQNLVWIWSEARDRNWVPTHVAIRS